MRLDGSVENAPLFFLPDSGYAIGTKYFSVQSRSRLWGKKRFHKRGHLDLPAAMTGYRRGRNSVTEVPFQVSQNLPQHPAPLKEQIDADYLRVLIKRDPSCTLKQLCDWVRDERSIMVSTTAMCRLLKGYNLQRRRSHRPHVYPSRSLTLAA
jgi:hypothetical protein